MVKFPANISKMYDTIRSIINFEIIPSDAINDNIIGPLFNS